MKHISEQESVELFNKRRYFGLTQKQLGTGIVSKSTIASWESRRAKRCNVLTWNAIQERLREYDCDDANRDEFMGFDLAKDGADAFAYAISGVEDTVDVAGLSWARALEAKKAYEDALANNNQAVGAYNKAKQLHVETVSTINDNTVITNVNKKDAEEKIYNLAQNMKACQAQAEQAKSDWESAIKWDSAVLKEGGLWKTRMEHCERALMFLFGVNIIMALILIFGG